METNTGKREARTLSENRKYALEVAAQLIKNDKFSSITDKFDNFLKVADKLEAFPDPKPEVKSVVSSEELSKFFALTLQNGHITYFDIKQLLDYFDIYRKD